MSSEQFAAAREQDPIQHTSLLGDLLGMGGSLLGGAAVGWALTALVEGTVAVGLAALEIGTGGLATPLVIGIGIGVAAVMEGSGLNDKIDHAAKALGNAIAPPEIKGKIASGSGNVYINNRPAARAAQPADTDTVACQNHSGPQMIADGSTNVYTIRILEGSLRRIRLGCLVGIISTLTVRTRCDGSIRGGGVPPHSAETWAQGQGTGWRTTILSPEEMLAIHATPPCLIDCVAWVLMVTVRRMERSCPVILLARLDCPAIGVIIRSTLMLYETNSNRWPGCLIVDNLAIRNWRLVLIEFRAWLERGLNRVVMPLMR